MNSHMGERGLFPAPALGQHGSHLHTPSTHWSTVSQTPKAKLPPATSLHWVRGTRLTVAKVILRWNFKYGFIFFCVFIYWRGFSSRTLWRSSTHLCSIPLWLHHSLTCCNTFPVNLCHAVGLPLSAFLLSIYLWCPWNTGQNRLCAQYAGASVFYQCRIVFHLPFLYPCDRAVKSLGQGLQVSSVLPRLWDECSAGHHGSPQMLLLYKDTCTPSACMNSHVRQPASFLTAFLPENKSLDNHISENLHKLKGRDFFLEKQQRIWRTKETAVR